MKTILCLLLFLFTQIDGLLAQQTVLQPIPEFKVIGNGPDTLLLIPCMSCRWNEWERFMNDNQARYTMYAVTVPGYGGTQTPDIPTNTEQPLWRNNLLQVLSNFIDEQKITNATVVGHSWGTMIAIQLAARRPDIIRRVITVDGNIENDSWGLKTNEERLTRANNIILAWEEKLKDPEEWRKFNSVGLPQQDSIERQYAEAALLLHGSFMATSKIALLQYWRENVLIDLTANLKKVKAPILDIQCFTEPQQDQQKAAYLKTLQDIGNPSNVKTIFFYDTRHFVMFHRPKELENAIDNFIKGKPLEDFVPPDLKQ